MINPMQDPRQGQTSGAVSVEFMGRLLDMNTIYENVAGRKVDGDIVLCGVKDWMAVAIPAILAGRESEMFEIEPRKIFAYGWTNGWPEPSEFDLKSPRNPKRGENPLNEGQILQYIKETGILERYPSLEINISDEKLIPEYSGEIAVLYLDTNLYEPTKDALENLWPQLVDGSLLIPNNHKEFPSKLWKQGNSAYAKTWQQYSDSDEKWPGASLAAENVIGKRSDELIQIPGTTLHYLIK